jgi:hypothetical protein
MYELFAITGNIWWDIPLWMLCCYVGVELVRNF